MEYLASGKPIVSTTFPALEPYRGLVQIADDSAAMIEALEMSRQLVNLKTFSTAMRNTVVNNDWARQAHRAEQWLEAL